MLRHKLTQQDTKRNCGQISFIFSHKELHGQNTSESNTQAIRSELKNKVTTELMPQDTTNCGQILEHKEAHEQKILLFFFLTNNGATRQQLRPEFYDKGHDLEQGTTRSDLFFFFEK